MSSFSNSSVLSNASREAHLNPQMTQKMQALPTEQQLKYLHLEAEVEVLLQQLQTMKQRRSNPPCAETDRLVLTK
ncbi:MAG: hypothetical protein SAJ12_18125 [Jaaginema sp. PMC 1079.18]|nr:hypothetical protein [Jaaginema sp. PMC 1080.18]MEC4852902.1 hypothetical protein [Jaaginema sp. PMC 1079.18]MEC4864606.1 hypothetical protein [Jaaginema sp. PMC 1078.18]